MPPAFNLSQDQTLEFNLCWIIKKMIRRTHLELKRNVISSSFQTWAPSFFVLSFLEIPKNFLVILKSKPDTHAYRFVDQLLKNISFRSFELTKLSILIINFVLSSQFWNIFHFFDSLSFAVRGDKDVNYDEVIFVCQINFNDSRYPLEIHIIFQWDRTKNIF